MCIYITMIDLVFLKFMRRLVLSLFFIVVCVFDFYGMNDKFNLDDGPLGVGKKIGSLDKKDLEEPRIDYNLGDMRPNPNQIELKWVNCSINNQNYYQKNYNFRTNKEGNNMVNMLLPIQNNSTLEKPQELTYFIKKETSSPFFSTTFKDSKKGTSKNNEENTTCILQGEKRKRISEFLNNPTYSDRINKYHFAKTLKDKDFVQLWHNDFQDTCKKLFPEEYINDFELFFLEFYFCHKISIKPKEFSESGPFLSDNAEKVKDLLQEDISLLGKRVCLAHRFKSKFDDLLMNTEAKPNSDLMMDGYIKGVIDIFHRGNSANAQALNQNQYMFLYRNFVFGNEERLNKLFVRDILWSNFGEGFINSIVKHRTLLFRFIPTFIYNIFDLGRFIKDFYTYSNDGRYSLSFYNVPLILGKTSPLFFNIFQVDFFLNFPLGIFLSCLDFCAYSILRWNLSEAEEKGHSSFQKFFLVWRPFVSDDVDISFISEKSEKEKFEKEECYSAFASVVLKVLTNFVGVNFNIKVKDNYFFSINLMSLVDDFILREYFLDSFNYSSKNLRPSSWSIFYETNNKEVL